jgi:hypothetical protein
MKTIDHIKSGDLVYCWGDIINLIICTSLSDAHEKIEILVYEIDRFDDTASVTKYLTSAEWKTSFYYMAKDVWIIR